jgi:hypothetical protein
VSSLRIATGVSAAKADRAINLLRQQGRVVRGTVRRGNNQDYDGYRLAPPQDTVSPDAS